MDWGIGEAVGS